MLDEAARQAEELNSRCGEGLQLELNPEAALHLNRDGLDLALVPLVPLAVDVEQGFLAPRYGQRVTAPVVRFHARIHAGVTVGYAILVEGA
jgi:hypothetical protein